MKLRKNEDLLSIIANCEGDQKKMWRHLKSFIDDREPPPSCIIVNDQKHTDDKEIADKHAPPFITSRMRLYVRSHVVLAIIGDPL